MPIGRPDWYSSGLSEISATLDDMAELAVRLGSAVNYDRTGKIIFIDTFTRFDGLYTVTSSGVASGPAVTSTIAETDNSSLHTQLSLGIANNVSIARSSRTWSGKVLSIEVGFNCDVLPDQIYFTCGNVVDGYFYNGIIRVTSAGTLFEVYDNASGYVTFETASYTPLLNLAFNAMKIAVDMSTKKYLYFRLNNVEYDLTQYNLYSGIDLSADYISNVIKVFGNSGSVLNFYLDRMIITEDM